MIIVHQPVASLPMYDWPEISHDYDALWAALSSYLCDHGIAAPDHLSRSSTDGNFWLHPNLLVGQTCGFPLWSRLRGQVSVLGTPHYAVEGCSGFGYSSAVLARADTQWTDLSQFRKVLIAVNEVGSLSGHLAMRAVLGGLPKGYLKITGVQRSGAHKRSMQMVADGMADLCAIDAVCWQMAQDFLPHTAKKLKVVGWSPQMPGLPWITAQRSEKELQTLRLTLKSFFSESTYKSVYKVLKISGFSETTVDDYSTVGALADGESHPLFAPLLC
ncbi:MAG: PhnD/SsuA/transferrin family substrate-binding protein [Hyphomicrobiales bacterium]